MPVLATLKCLGAPARLIFRIYFLQVIFLAMLGTFTGLVLAAMGPLLAEQLLGSRFAIPMKADCTRNRCSWRQASAS